MTVTKDFPCGKSYLIINIKAQLIASKRIVIIKIKHNNKVYFYFLEVGL